MKKEIEEKLSEVLKRVYYGVGRFQDGDDWNCIIFKKRKRKSEKGFLKKYWVVAVVSEEEVTDEMVDEVISKMRELKFKRTETDVEYAYFDKSGECVVETCTIEFHKSEKGCE